MGILPRIWVAAHIPRPHPTTTFLNFHPRSISRPAGLRRPLRYQSASPAPHCSPLPFPTLARACQPLPAAAALEHVTFTHDVVAPSRGLHPSSGGPPRRRPLLLPDAPSSGARAGAARAGAPRPSSVDFVPRRTLLPLPHLSSPPRSSAATCTPATQAPSPPVSSAA